MTAGLRDMLVRHYRREIASVDGVPASTFVLAATVWARIEPPTAREVTVGQGADHRVDGVLTADAFFEPSVNDLIVDPDGVRWELRAVLPRRATRDRQCFLERGQQAQGAYTLVDPS